MGMPRQCTLLEVVIVLGLLAARGYGELLHATCRAAESAIPGVVEAGLERSEWNLNERHDVRAICRIFAAFERQLAEGPAEVVTGAFRDTAKLGAGLKARQSKAARRRMAELTRRSLLRTA